MSEIEHLRRRQRMRRLETRLEQGERLREARRMAGLSQRELADVLGVSERSVTAYERGQTTIPGRLLPVIERALGASSSWILRGQEDRRSEEEISRQLGEVIELLNEVLRRLS